MKLEQLVRVKEARADGTALVIHIRESACSGDCHKCSGCGAATQTMILVANNPIGAKPGQVVTVRSESGPVLAAAAVLYVLPLMLFFAGYLLMETICQKGALGGCVAFGLGIAFAAIYDRKVAAKRKPTYTITGLGSMPSPTPEKGDNDLD